MVANPTPRSATFKSYQQDFHKALEDEIKALRSAGGSMTPITDGHYLGRRNSEHLYSFTTDTEIRFPEDAPIDVHYQKTKYPGTLVSVEGFDLLVALEDDIGDDIKKAKLNTEPWFLLKALQERLATANVSTIANRHLAESLLIASPKAARTSNEQFSQFAPRIQSETGLNLHYNIHQAAAVTHILQHPVSFIWGPPGTGKTSTLGLAVASLVHSGQSVLVLAHSNAAVDTAMKSVAKYLCQSSYYREGMVLRFGIPSPDIYRQYPMLNARGIVRQQHPQLIEQIETLEKQREHLTKESRASGLSTLIKNQLKDQLAQIRKQLQPLKKQLREYQSVLVAKGMVVGCTLSKATIAKEIFERQFDAVIIDEASMAYIPHCTYGATLAKKRIAIFGDFRQLAPVSQAKTSNAEEFLQRDIFDEAGIIDSVSRGTPDDRLVLLKTQYRMHPSISAIPNELFYKNQLEDGEGVRERTEAIVHAAPNLGQSIVFYDLSRASAFCFSEDHRSRFNLISALIAADITYQAQIAGTQSIGLITPYSAQARLIHRILRETGQKNVKAATVHRFQGSEQNVIVFDAVDSHQMKKASKLLVGGSQSTAARLANVAISRAEGKFIGLFNDDFLKVKLDSFNIFRKFIDRLRSRAEVRPLSFTGAPNTELWTFTLPNVKVYPNAKAAQADIHADLKAAAKSVAIDWPIQLKPSQHFYLNVDRGLQVFARGPEAEAITGKISNRRVWRNDSFSDMGIVGLDGQVLWVYTNPRAEAPVFKVALPETVTLLYDFLELVPDGAGPAPKPIEDTFGSCELCNSPLWPQINDYGQPRIICPKHPYQGRNFNTTDATQYAQMMNRVCNICRSAFKGVRSASNGSIFLACSAAGCKGKASLRDLI
ncbi:AAA family ATPase [Leptolyngbya sp. FACHB-321]|uniref:DEAD/DEAH box helicase n=1 Tax=Leptolyngbya sp. FACHB-321 TaxID=2692807 RepID=UPI001681FB5D|nr:AAA domain-containing protein [Leptolyngbya sp. FACHB-321]MBD2036580.1 AAA family ATPase [Leptolyngbya sp. FACHB-321]